METLTWFSSIDPYYLTFYVIRLSKKVDDNNYNFPISIYWTFFKQVFKGLSLMSENTLIDTPTGLVAFHMDATEPRVPGTIN